MNTVEERTDNMVQEIYESYYRRPELEGLQQIIGEIYLDAYPNLEEIKERVNSVIEKKYEEIKNER